MASIRVSASEAGTTLGGGGEVDGRVWVQVLRLMFRAQG